MKTTFRYLLFLFSILSWGTQAEELNSSSFAVLHLNYPGLEKVKALVTSGKYDAGAVELLRYYRERTSIKHPDYNVTDRAQYAGKPLEKTIMEKVDKALVHQFEPHEGYGYFDYGQDINWQYWPVKDNEVRWVLHRVYWWRSMGLAYWATGDEKYAKEWVLQFRDWVKKNPLGLSADNDRFAWRPLEVSTRVQDLTGTFNIFISSPNFTPAFLLDFLNSYHQQAAYIPQHYSDAGNHLLFEAQRLLYAGGFFPELKGADTWRKSGIEVLNREITKQVYADGMQFELSPVYHYTTVNIFLKALRMAQLSGIEKEFPDSFKQTTEKMIMANINYSYPDYSFPMFGDSWLVDQNLMQKQYQNWLPAFPNNPIITYFATAAKEGTPPPYLSHGLDVAGFYTFRNGWNKKATVMVVKASPPGEFHAQPDNGTFELWVKGRNFTPDAGCYVYSGDAEITKMRNWYRQTRVHSTLTLDNQNMLITQAQQNKWQTSKDLDILTYTNPSYTDLKHQRTVLFINQRYFVIIDKAIGKATGNLGTHFQLKEDSQPVFDKTKNRVYTTYADGNNLLIQSLNTDKVALTEEDGKVSYSYQKEVKRPAFVFEKLKNDAKTQNFITVVYPYQGAKAPVIKLKENTGNDFEKGTINLLLEIDGIKTDLKTGIQ
jgi:heparan-sulfate lyase